MLSISSWLLQQSAAAAPYLGRGYLLTAAPSDLERGIAPLGPPAPAHGKEMHIKTTMRYHLRWVRMAIIKKSTNNKCQRGCGEKGTLLHCWW